MLLLGQGDAGDVGLADIGQIEAEPAPARADVEHLEAGPQQELCRDMALLVGLRLLDAGVELGEIRAGILAVAVEEEVEEIVAEVVVVGDVELRRARRIVLRDAPCELPQAGHDRREGSGGVAQPDIVEDECEEVVDVALARRSGVHP